MQFIKYFILLILFAITTFLGYIISKKYSERLKELKQMKNCLNIFKNKIKFTYEPIPEIFKEISKTNQNSIGKIFESSAKQMTCIQAGIAWEQAINTSNTNLNKEDKETLNNLGRLLGQTDVEGQINQIELVNKFLDEQIIKADEENEKSSKMYKKLGVIIGLALVIILI